MCRSKHFTLLSAYCRSDLLPGKIRTVRPAARMMRTSAALLGAPIHVQLRYAIEKILELQHRVIVLETALEEIGSEHALQAAQAKMPPPEELVQSVHKLDLRPDPYEPPILSDPGPSTAEIDRT